VSNSSNKGKAQRCGRQRGQLESKAHVLAEQLGRSEEAVQVLDRAVAFYPEYAPAIAARGVLLARLGRREAARQDAEKALSIDRSAPIVFQVAGIYALLSQQQSDDRFHCLALLATALRQG
jgi:eukaryotic-like serine/threonine-protein kinase